MSLAESHIEFSGEKKKFCHDKCEHHLDRLEKDKYIAGCLASPYGFQWWSGLAPSTPQAMTMDDLLVSGWDDDNASPPVQNVCAISFSLSLK